MQVALSWLKEFINLDGLSAAEIARVLTDLGLEVEHINHVSPLKGEVLVGLIEKAAKVEGSDHLNLCQVRVDQKTETPPLSIVCGAPNARAGIKVAVAMIGSELPGDFKVKESKIKGQKSQGMLCSEKELGLSAEHEGIMELKADSPLGASVDRLLGLGDEVLEINITPNRGDCLSHYGLARELSARLGRELKSPPLFNPAGLKKGPATLIADPTDSPSFHYLKISGLHNGESPQWLKQHLEHVGLRPRGMIVDVTNWVMLSYGLPVHAYDAQKVESPLSVRKAHAGETIKLLDESTKTLAASDIVISDQKDRPLALAGIMGGHESAVSASTEAIYLEAAIFDELKIRKTSKRLNLHTDASHRYERKVNPAGPEMALAEALRVWELLGLKPQVETYHHTTKEPISPKRIALRLDRLRQISGLSIYQADEVMRLLSGLGIKLLDQTEGRLLLEIPGFRHDIQREIDLIEEVARVKGYESIPLSLPAMDIAGDKEDPFIAFTEKARSSFALLGQTETISFPFISEAQLQSLCHPEQHPFRKSYALANPISADLSFLQPFLAPNLLQAMDTNHRFGFRGVRLFEIARIFLPQESSQGQTQGSHITGKARTELRPLERTQIGAIWDTQSFPLKTWDGRPQIAWDFYKLKGLVLEWAKSLELKALNFKNLSSEAKYPWLLAPQSALICAEDQVIGYLGRLHPELALAKGYEIKASPWLMECDLENLFAFRDLKPHYAKPSHRYPTLTRDLSLLVPKNKSFADLKEALANFPQRKYLKQETLFDLYSGQELGADLKSLAFHLEFSHPDRTLKEAEADQELKALWQWLEKSLQAKIRNDLEA